MTSHRSLYLISSLIGSPTSKVASFLPLAMVMECESTPLINQAGGCLATTIALQFGKQPTKQQLMHLVNAVLEIIDDRILECTNERAEEFQVTTGVGWGETSFGDAPVFTAMRPRRFPDLHAHFVQLRQAAANRFLIHPEMPGKLFERHAVRRFLQECDQFQEPICR